ncbi:hypothetical protein P3342_000927 [Pyrenophora teres f. teres]|nr:hypothetical protein P3342_000927 [Pyrenophora teres f. teres]
MSPSFFFFSSNPRTTCAGAKKEDWAAQSACTLVSRQYSPLIAGLGRSYMQSKATRYPFPRRPARRPSVHHHSRVGPFPRALHGSEFPRVPWTFSFCQQGAGLPSAMMTATLLSILLLHPSAPFLCSRLP